MPSISSPQTKCSCLRGVWRCIEGRWQCSVCETPIRPSSRGRWISGEPSAAGRARLDSLPPPSCPRCRTLPAADAWQMWQQCRWLEPSCSACSLPVACWPRPKSTWPTDLPPTPLGQLALQQLHASMSPLKPALSRAALPAPGPQSRVIMHTAQSRHNPSTSTSSRSSRSPRPSVPAPAPKRLRLRAPALPKQHLLCAKYSTCGPKQGRLELRVRRNPRDSFRSGPLPGAPALAFKLESFDCALRCWFEGSALWEEFSVSVSAPQSSAALAGAQAALSSVFHATRRGWNFIGSCPVSTAGVPAFSDDLQAHPSRRARLDAIVSQWRSQASAWRCAKLSNAVRNISHKNLHVAERIIRNKLYPIVRQTVHCLLLTAIKEL